MIEEFVEKNRDNFLKGLLEFNEIIEFQIVLTEITVFEFLNFQNFKFNEF